MYAATTYDDDDGGGDRAGGIARRWVGTCMGKQYTCRYVNHGHVTTSMEFAFSM